MKHDSNTLYVQMAADPIQTICTAAVQSSKQEGATNPSNVAKASANVGRMAG
jgi:hypothetical protein